ncbi:hypothetical protein AZI86_05710 [Bdellovibrio bacteriovorus]|uniref:Secreted protein n=1 Tax=Bdellovibrio bacteriovorus TaxID=959 RepID=A0A150WQ36_BDEBC|nr:hypothetical protein [Bdellovibrio bacteriovorus]KYG66540.1 hypothetical protein AZI86_05710 [Bdellovibrio bacteriovorus]
MLRLLLTAALAAGALATSSPSVASTISQGDYEEHVMPANDRWVPWPWSSRQPIPWSDIQGLWKVEQDDFISYFSFKVVTLKSTGIRQLQVKQFDGDSCKVLSNGVGVETNKKILAQMTSKSGNIYRVELTAFSEEDLRKEDIPPLRGGIPTREAMVLSLSPIDSSEVYHMQIVKISAFVTQKFCFEDIRK